MAVNKVSEMFSVTSEKFRGLIDANSVVGEPIAAGDGTLIVPVSKVSFGFGGGGTEFDSDKSTDTRFGGGMGGGASVKAEAFLVINNNNVRLVPMGGSNAPLDKLVDLVPDILDKVNNVISDMSKKKAKKNTAEIIDEENAETGATYDND